MSGMDPPIWISRATSISTYHRFGGSTGGGAVSSGMTSSAVFAGCFAGSHGSHGSQVIPIEPPLAVPARSWVAIEWREGDETATARILGPEEPTPGR